MSIKLEFCKELWRADVTSGVQISIGTGICNVDEIDDCDGVDGVDGRVFLIPC